MGTPQTRVVLPSPGVAQVALATIVPLLVAIFATSGTLLAVDRFGQDKFPLVLAGWSTVLLGSAAWLNQVFSHRIRTLLPFLTAIGAILTIWLWQRHAFALFVPKAGLTFGYFLAPGGAGARFRVLVCPFWAGVACLSVCVIVALVCWWRTGARLSMACMIPWWLAAFVIFALPSMYLDGQGNASVFI
jgi:hypothetical protein